MKQNKRLIIYCDDIADELVFLRNNPPSGIHVELVKLMSTTNINKIISDIHSNCKIFKGDCAAIISKQGKFLVDFGLKDKAKCFPSLIEFNEWVTYTYKFEGSDLFDL